MLRVRDLRAARLVLGWGEGQGSNASSSFSYVPHRRQEERGLQKFHSFVLVSNFQKDIGKMRQQVAVIKGDAEEIADHW